LDLRPDLANHQNFIDIYGLCMAVFENYLLQLHQLGCEFDAFFFGQS
jgi:hypothetical protein